MSLGPGLYQFQLFSDMMFVSDHVLNGFKVLWKQIQGIGIGVSFSENAQVCYLHVLREEPLENNNGFESDSSTPSQNGERIVITIKFLF